MTDSAGRPEIHTQPVAGSDNTRPQAVWVDILNPESLPVPAAEDFQRWVATALRHEDPQRWSQPGAEPPVSLKIVSMDESQALNRDYRGKDKPTNVLSFPADWPEELALPILGDLAICAEVVAQEAAAQHKPLGHHWAHLVIHGVLHLLGYDHIAEEDAQRMEAREVALLAELGIPDPYQCQDNSAV